MLFYRDLICPKCRKVYGFQFVNVMLLEVGTGLGPPLVRCVSCGAVFDPGLTEWFRMSNSQKTRFVFLSVIYAVANGMIIALIPLFIFDGIFNPSKFRVSMSTPIALPVIFLCALPVLGFQLLRIIKSNKRVRDNLRKPMNVSFWNWQANPQGLWLSLSIIIILVGCIVGYIRGVI